MQHRHATLSRGSHQAFVLSLLTLLLLSGCGSAPASRFYVLTPGEVASPTQTTPAVGVGPIHVPEFLEREAMIVGREDARLKMASNHRWAEPLAEGIGRVMAINLTALLDTQAVQRFPWRRDQQPGFAVKVDIWQLESHASDAQLIAQWSVQETATDKTLVQQISRFTVPLRSSEDPADAVPGAFSELLFQLSKEIAQVISRAELE